MDVNAVWVPHALEATGRILDAVRALGLDARARAGRRHVRRAARRRVRARRGRAAAGGRDVARRRAALRGAARRLGGAGPRGGAPGRDAGRRAGALDRAADSSGALRDSLTFLAVALDSAGAPVARGQHRPGHAALPRRGRAGAGAGAAPGDAAADSALLRDVRLFARAYPAGLLVARVGPAVSNDAYAAPAVWREFDRDPYHGPKVVWGREVNLFLLGVADRIAAAGAGRAAYVRELRDAFDRVGAAAEAAGFKSELWSYEVRDGAARAVRYGSGNDVQLWTTTDLAVQFARSKLR
jgi:hypothetical protein